jgi:hypothetical protein
VRIKPATRIWVPQIMRTLAANGLPPKTVADFGTT